MTFFKQILLVKYENFVNAYDLGPDTYHSDDHMRTT